MNKNIVLALKITGLVLFASFVFYVGLHFIDRIFIFNDKGYAAAGVGAFMGAFAAYGFTVLGEYIKKITTRRAKGYNALIKATHILNGLLNDAGDNTHTIKTAIEAFENGRFFTFSFIYFETDKDIVSEFSNIDLTNDFFTLNIDMKRFNLSAENCAKNYEQLRTLILDNKIDETSYRLNMKNMVMYLKELEKFCKLLEDKIIDLCTHVRIEIGETSPRHLIFVQKKYSNEHKKLFLTEREKYQAEIEKTGLTSDEEHKKYGLKKI